MPQIRYADTANNTDLVCLILAFRIQLNIEQDKLNWFVMGNVEVTGSNRAVVISGNG